MILSERPASLQLISYGDHTLATDHIDNDRAVVLSVGSEPVPAFLGGFVLYPVHVGIPLAVPLLSADSRRVMACSITLVIWGLPAYCSTITRSSGNVSGFIQSCDGSIYLLGYFASGRHADILFLFMSTPQPSGMVGSSERTSGGISSLPVATAQFILQLNNKNN